MKIFLTNKNFSPESYPEYIRNIQDETKRKYRQKHYKVAKKYAINAKTKRLKICFNISNKANFKYDKDFLLFINLKNFMLLKKYMIQ